MTAGKRLIHLARSRSKIGQLLPFQGRDRGLGALEVEPDPAREPRDFRVLQDAQHSLAVCLGGRGVLVSRGRTGEWNGPSFYTIGTASFGLQAGVDVSDIVVLVMTQRGMNALLTPSVRLGMDASVAAGPVGAGVGRPPRPDTDFIYFSRAKGFYGGVSLQGARIRPDDRWNAAYYGRPVSARDILVRGSVRHPGSRGLLETVDVSARVVARR